MSFLQTSVYFLVFQWIVLLKNRYMDRQLNYCLNLLFFCNFGHRIPKDRIRQTVRQSSNYFSNSQPVGISHATVTISNGDTTFTLSESQNGEYLTDADVLGVEGKTYMLKVIVEFN
ncbi:hypothetical protein EZS27_038877, partial [termite gut metagenome]